MRFVIIVCLTLTLAANQARKWAQRPGGRNVADLQSVSITSPNRRYSVEFSRPEYVGADETDTAYKLVTVQARGAAPQRVANYLGKNGALAPYSAKRRWSPDGDYLIVTEVTRVSSTEGSFGQEFMKVLDLEAADFVDFETSADVIARFANFDGWDPAKPHTMWVLVNGKRQEANPQE
jgi:hypothetical protein